MKTPTQLRETRAWSQRLGYEGNFESQKSEIARLLITEIPALVDEITRLTAENAELSEQNAHLVMGVNSQ